MFDFVLFFSHKSVRRERGNRERVKRERERKREGGGRETEREEGLVK